MKSEIASLTRKVKLQIKLLFRKGKRYLKAWFDQLIRQIYRNIALEVPQNILPVNPVVM